MKCKFCKNTMVTKIHHMEECFGPVLAEEFCICPECGATYEYSFGYEKWLTKEEQEEFDKKYDEYMEQRQEQVQSNNESCDELPW